MTYGKYIIPCGQFHKGVCILKKKHIFVALSALLLSSCAGQHNAQISDNFLLNTKSEAFNTKPARLTDNFSDEYDSQEVSVPEYKTEEKDIVSDKLEITGNEYNSMAHISDESRFIVVNIPSQLLRVFENGREVLRTTVIVGAPESRTPEMETYINGVVLWPNWTVPPRGRIEKKYTSLINEGKADVLAENGIIWKKRSDGTYQFSQPSGENNALGKIKFDMHSPTYVYLHDTNRPDLYNKARRALSNGCVRVKNYQQLAAWLMGISPEEFYAELYKTSSTRRISTPKVKLYIVYQNKEIIDGKEVVWEDIYNKN